MATTTSDHRPVEQQTVARAVIVDGDASTRALLASSIASELLVTHSYATGAEALTHVATRGAEIVLLDLHLPDAHGIDFIQDLRRVFVGGIVVMSSTSSVAERLQTYRLGADDFIGKPYDPAEAAARVHAVVRRCSRQEREAAGLDVHVRDAVLSISGLTYRSAAISPTLMTPTEMRLLECVMRRPGIAVGRDEIVERVWGHQLYGDANRLDVYVRRVRQKIEPHPAHPDYLLTERGIGYVFSNDSDLAGHRC